MRKLKYFFFSIIVLLLLFFVYIVTYSTVESKVYDFMTKHVLTEKLPFDNHKNVYGSDDIVLIVIDDKTADKYRWPWKRELFCKIFDYLHDYAEPKVVAHDAVFITMDADNSESDKKLFKTFSKFDSLIEGFIPSDSEWEDKQFGEKYDKKFSKKFALKNVENLSLYTPQWYQSLYSFPNMYFDSINKVGSVSTPYIDNNTTLKTYEYIFYYKDNFYPSLALQTFLTLNNNPEIVLSDDKMYFPDSNVSVNLFQTPYLSFSFLKFYKQNGDNPNFTHTKFSALDIMDSYDNILKGKKPIINPEVFKNKIVVIGANVLYSEGLVDTKHSPLMQDHPGVDIQATAIDNIVHNDFLKIIPMWVNFLITFLGMLFVYYAIRRFDTFKAVISSLGIIFAYLLISIICFYFVIVINVITPIVMFAVTMIIAYIRRYIIENANKKKVENALGKYMSEDVMKNVVKNIDNLGLGGKKAVVTVLFSDIRGFTSMSEKMTAEEVTQILNEYFSEMEPIVKKYDGIINKFIGDAVMAIFGEPIQNEQHPINAVKCGYEMLEKVKELREKWNGEGKPDIHIGVGVNTGEVFVGNIGSVNRMEYTVIGDTVNLASRLESYNKTYGTSMLISSSTYEFSKEILEVREIKDVEIRGKAEKMNIYEILEVK